jgi:hypothetical protein
MSSAELEARRIFVVQAAPHVVSRSGSEAHLCGAGSTTSSQQGLAIASKSTSSRERQSLIRAG